MEGVVKGKKDRRTKRGREGKGKEDETPTR